VYQRVSASLNTDDNAGEAAAPPDDVGRRGFVRRDAGVRSRLDGFSALGGDLVLPR
jgi:hypothetical protein